VHPPPIASDPFPGLKLYHPKPIVNNNLRLNQRPPFSLQGQKGLRLCPEGSRKTFLGGGVFPRHARRISRTPSSLTYLIFPSSLAHPFTSNAALSGAPEGHPSRVPGSPRSVAEGRNRHYRSAPRSPRSEAEGGTPPISGGCKSSAGFVCSALLFRNPLNSHKGYSTAVGPFLIVRREIHQFNAILRGKRIES